MGRFHDVEGISRILNFGCHFAAARVSPVCPIISAIGRSQNPIRVVPHVGFEGDYWDIGVLEAENAGCDVNRIEHRARANRLGDQHEAFARGRCAKFVRCGGWGQWRDGVAFSP